jgi:hypothetical protein
MLCPSPSNIAGGIFKRDSVAAYYPDHGKDPSTMAMLIANSTKISEPMPIANSAEPKSRVPPRTPKK